MKFQVDGATQFNTIEIELSKMYGCLLEVTIAAEGRKPTPLVEPMLLCRAIRAMFETPQSSSLTLFGKSAWHCGAIKNIKM